MMRPKATRQTWALIGTATLLAACSDNTGPGRPPQAPLLAVVVTDGVAGSPASGTSSRAKGDTVTYQYAATAGYRDLEVRIDDSLVPNSGSLVVSGDHVVRATAFPVLAMTPETQTVEALYAAADPGPLSQALAKEITWAALRGDQARVRALAVAEAAVLERIGVDGMLKTASRLAGKTFLVLGDSVASAALRAVPSRPGQAVRGPTFPDDTLVPTTFVFVNGILNWSANDAGKSVEALVSALQAAGFSEYLKDPAGARPEAPVRVVLHYNPVVSLQNPLLECLHTLHWALTVANGMTQPGDRPSLRNRVLALLWKARAIHGACKDPSLSALFTTNLRAIEQYLAANADALAPPNIDDRAFLAFIEQERALAGGRDVVVVGHSQGTLIARNVLALSAPGRANVGCLGAVAVAAPFSDSRPWPGADARAAVIAKGTEPWSADLLYRFGGDRGDGQRSGLTDDLDDELRAHPTSFPPLVSQYELHLFVAGYMAADGKGMPDAIGRLSQQQYLRVATPCAGTLTGTVQDLATRQPIAGATVQARAAGVNRGSAVQTTVSGSFETPRLLPILHDLVVTAPGHDTVILPQRLVPFRSTVAAQGGAILLGAPCIAACSMQGTFDLQYQISGAILGFPVACAFEAHASLVQPDSTFTGTITTDQYQQGCQVDADHYVYWTAGVLAVSGVQRGTSFELHQPATPPIIFSGTVQQGGFRAIVPLWGSGPPYLLRVELTATRRSATVAAGQRWRTASTASFGIPALGGRQ